MSQGGAMIENFLYHVPEKIYFGKGSLSHLPKEIEGMRRILMVYGGGSIKENGIYETVLSALHGHDVVELSGIRPNPTLSKVEAGIAIGRKEAVDAILAVGGGSVIDSAKMIAAGISCDKDVWALVRRKEQVETALSIFAVPTMAATGSEMNDGLVLTKEETKEKWGYSSPALLPQAAFLDPTFTYTVSAHQTACGVADMLSHVMEVYFNLQPGFPLMDEVMEGLMRTIMETAPKVLLHPTDYDGRANLLWASEWAINGLIDGGASVPWSCHGIEHELSAFYDIPHGEGLAIVTPSWMAYVLSSETAPRFSRWATKVMGVSPLGDAQKEAKAGIEKLRQFFTHTLGLAPSLSSMNIDEKDFSAMARKVCAWKGINGVIHGFVPLKEEDVYEIYKRCL